MVMSFSLAGLNSGLILKTYTHAFSLSFFFYKGELCWYNRMVIIIFKMFIWGLAVTKFSAILCNDIPPEFGNSENSYSLNFLIYQINVSMQ